VNAKLHKKFEKNIISKKRNLDDLLDNSSSRELEQGLGDTNFTRL